MLSKLALTVDSRQSAIGNPALDLGKNKPIRVTHSPQPANPPR